MINQKRNYDAAFKAKIALELVKGQKTVNEIATENERDKTCTHEMYFRWEVLLSYKIPLFHPRNPFFSPAYGSTRLHLQYACVLTLYTLNNWGSKPCPRHWRKYLYLRKAIAPLSGRCPQRAKRDCYTLSLFYQFNLPVFSLDLGIKLSVFLCSPICLLPYITHVNSRYKLNLCPGKAVPRRGSLSCQTLQY